MNIGYKILIAATVSLIGYFLAQAESIVGLIIHYIGFVAAIIFSISWFNSTNRKK